MAQLTGRQKSRARRGAQALGIAAVATLLAGCSLASEVTAIFGTTDSTAVEWLTTPAGEPLWSADEQVFAGPIVVGNRVIAQVVADGALEVVAWDAENGEEVWSHPASTGAANPPKAWPLQIIQNDEGIPIVANLAPPSVSTVTLPDGTQGTVLQHRLNFIDVESGMAWGVSEPGHVYAERDCGFATAVCAQVLDVEQGLVGGAFPWKDVVIRYDGSSTPLLSDESYVSRMNIAPQLFVANRTDGGTSLLRFDGEQVRWDLDLAEVDLGGVPTARLAFGAGGSLEDGRSLMKVTLIDKGTPQTGVAEFRSTPVFMALDWQSGELLWHDRPVQADVGGLVKLGETSYVRNPGGSFDAVIDETTTLEHRDPLSGEPLWSLELADRESSVDALGAVLWSGDEHTVLLHSGGSWSAYDLEDGSLREPKDEEMFACYSRASSVLLPKASWPNGELAEYAAGSLAGGCLLDGVRITDPADWSRAAVALNSGFWTPHSDEFTDGNELYEEERYRVVSNEAGVHVYRF